MTTGAIWQSDPDNDELMSIRASLNALSERVERVAAGGAAQDAEALRNAVKALRERVQRLENARLDAGDIDDMAEELTRGIPDEVPYPDDPYYADRDEKVCVDGESRSGHLGAEWDNGVLQLNTDPATIVGGDNDPSGDPALCYIDGEDCVKLAHGDTSDLADTSNTGGVVIQNLTADDAGHVLTAPTIDLDGRYYREDEATQLQVITDIKHESNYIQVYYKTISAIVVTDDGWTNKIATEVCS